MRSRRILPTLALALLLPALPAAVAGQVDQLEPARLSSTGDSITEAIDAELPFANHWASWANGYTNFWTDLFGLTNVGSHNQRIDRTFPGLPRRNYMEALSGADSFDFPGQAQQSVDHAAEYVTVLMGHNDVCQNDFPDIPTDAEFEANMRAGLDSLRDGLPAGATVYVVGIVDIYKLWALGDELDALGFIPCHLLWATTLLDLFPCGTMLDPLNSEEDRQFTRSRNVAFNQILEDLVDEYSVADPDHFYRYTDVVFEAEFVASEVSGIDCFHPSAKGQRRLSRITWTAGPFGEF